MENPLWLLVAWVLAASLLGFATSAVFAGRFRLSRRRFLVPYVLLTSLFLYAFTVLNEIDILALLVANWVWGVLLGILVSLFLVRTVKAQPASRQSAGAGLAFDISWSGIVYGIMDGLFLNILPVVAVWQGTQGFAWTATGFGKIGVGLLGLLASLLVTFAYHWGYPEFRNRQVALVLAGNSLITLAFLLSGNPLGSLISHTLMHIAAVLQGPETTIQLPPHYRPLHP